jgi:hypothetical protein
MWQPAALLFDSCCPRTSEFRTRMRRSDILLLECPDVISWIMICACGIADRCPGSPAAHSTAAIDMALPTTTLVVVCVWGGGGGVVVVLGIFWLLRFSFVSMLFRPKATRVHTRTHAHTRTHTHARTHTRTQAHTNTHTHTHTHAHTRRHATNGDAADWFQAGGARARVLVRTAPRKKKNGTRKRRWHTRKTHVCTGERMDFMVS